MGQTAVCGKEEAFRSKRDKIWRSFEDIDERVRELRKLRLEGIVIFGEERTNELMQERARAGKRS
jgi:hypothetical protein